MKVDEGFRWVRKGRNQKLGDTGSIRLGDTGFYTGANNCQLPRKCVNFPPTGPFYYRSSYPAPLMGTASRLPCV